MMELRGARIAALDRIVSDLLQRPDGPPGVCLAISAGGNRVFSAGGRTRVVDETGPVAGEDMDLETRTDIGSVTKIAATTMALMALVDAGELDVRARVRQLLSWSAGRPIGEATITDLLQHRAGLWEWWPTYLEPGDPLEVVSGLPLRYPIGHGRHYSDLGFILLGAVLETATGQDLARAVTRLVLQPVGLEHTAYGTPVPGAPVAASSRGDSIEREMVRTGVPYPVRVDADAYDGWRERVLLGEVNDGNAYHSFGSTAGHAGLFSSAADLLTLGEAVGASLVGGGPISPETAAAFLKTGPDPCQALGFRVWELGTTQAFGHTGFPGVAFAVLPEFSVSAVLVTNRLHVAVTPIAVEPWWLETLSMIAEHGAAPWR